MIHDPVRIGYKENLILGHLHTSTVNLSSNKRRVPPGFASPRNRVRDDLAIATIDDAIALNILRDNCESSSFTRHR